MLTVHPLGPIVAGQVQVLASKRGEWRLLLNGKGHLEWRVNLATGWAIATANRQLSRLTDNEAFVIKATHSAGHVKVFSCLLMADFTCEMTEPDGEASGSLPLQVATPPQDIYFAAEDVSAVGNTTAQLGNGWKGAMEEIALWRLSLENVTAHLFSCPECGCTNFYIFDYTRAATRTWWAHKTANIFNSFGASSAQWDGA